MEKTSRDFIFSTGVTREQVKRIRNKIRTEMRIGRTSLRKIPMDRIPIAVIINGTGACGKGTFIEHCGRFCSVEEISAVDPLYDVAETLMGMSDNENLGLFVDPVPSSNEQREHKTEEFRSLMHELKKAWATYHNGPETYLIGRAISFLLTRREPPQIIFENCREPENIESLVNAHYDVGIVPLTLLMRGNVRPEDHSCYADTNVENYDYDMVIDNIGSILDLRLEAAMFTHRLMHANERFGIPFDPGSNLLNVIKTYQQRIGDGRPFDRDDMVGYFKEALLGRRSVDTLGAMAEDPKEQLTSGITT